MVTSYFHPSVCLSVFERGVEIAKILKVLKKWRAEQKRKVLQLS